VKLDLTLLTEECTVTISDSKAKSKIFGHKVDVTEVVQKNT